jgi:hypothetical protein
MADARARRWRYRASKARSKPHTKFLCSDPAKAFILRCAGQLVASGDAHSITLDNGDIELSLNSGETFLLGERAVIRLA